MGLGIRDLLGEQNQEPEETSQKRVELQSSSLSSTETLARDALAQGSISGHILVPAQARSSVLISLPLGCHGLGMGGWQRALAAPVGLDLTGSCVLGRLLLSRAGERV